VFRRDRAGGIASADRAKNANHAQAVWGLLGSDRCNLNFGFDSSSKNQTRFWSKLVPFFYVSRKRINKLECFWEQGASCYQILGSVAKPTRSYATKPKRFFCEDYRFNLIANPQSLKTSFLTHILFKSGLP